ncbi:MAG: glycosyltransferase family 39 protein [Rugosibacter sp.]|nr:glycosyltransferase family 39 protein [Rugosibacter sp.]
MNCPSIALSASQKNQLYVLVLLMAGIDISLFGLLYSHPEALAAAHIASFLVAASGGSVLASFGPLRGNHALGWCQLPSLLVITLLTLFLRGGMLASLMHIGALSATTAQIISALLSAALFHAASVFFIYSRRIGLPAEVRWNHFVPGVIAYSILLRLAYLGVPELLFEEAYYWNYAKHLDIGYLDHPLMVAWTIKPFIVLLGNIELAVRGGAFLFWFVTAYFSYRLAREIFDKAIAWRSVLLIAVLPAYFSFGFFISPDAPLTAFWSMATYFAYRIIIKDERKAWLGLGVALGLGMISKYTIALLGAAIVLYVISDRRSRKWLRRPEPYIGLVIALFLCSPVLIWNMQNEWASFAFQSQGRLVSKSVFSLPRFILNALLLLTPIGVLSVIALLRGHKQLLSTCASNSQQDAQALRQSYRLLAWLTLFPVLVFASLSLFKASKLNWTGPAWLPLMPFMALLVTEKSISGAGKLLQWCRRAWLNTAIICLLFYAVAFHYLGPGLPGVRYPHNVHLIGWQDFGREIEAVVTQLERETGEQILVVGFDRNRIASGLAFYRAYGRDATDSTPDHDPASTTASEHLFDAVGLMYEMWFPVNQQAGKAMLLVAENAAVLERDTIRSRVSALGPIQSIQIRKNGRPAGQFFYRLAKGYRGNPAPQDSTISGQTDNKNDIVE